MKPFLLLGTHLLIAAICLGQAENADTSLLQPVEVLAIRATDKTPIAKTTLSRKEIGKQNVGMDLPFILNQTPSVVANADAGNGIGYTSLRIRGTDATRINVTLNGIPYNDAESQGSFLVNIPDIASSAGSIQVQRGVGTSTNGAGAFGGSINLSTNEVVTTKSLEFNNTAGSYHSFKNTVLFNSGLLGKHFTFDGRLSNIRSDGYIDRASTRLQSFYTSAAYVTSNNSLRLNIFSGKEKTYQAWNGVDEETLKTDRRFNSAGTEKSGEPYSNETDNYTQTHYQLFYNHKFNNEWKANLAVFLTAGEGYYEQYKAAAELPDYGLPPYNDAGTMVTASDIIRQLWLHNNFYGSIFSLQYNKTRRQIIFGGGVNKYEGQHFGEIIWAQVPAAVPPGYRYYDNDAQKTDLSAYAKWTEQLGRRWQTFLDLQVRKVNYSVNGFKYNPSLVIRQDYIFFNPKAGFTYSWNNMQAFVSYGRAAKEPNRDDFESNATDLARPEKLNDYEAGLSYKKGATNWGINLYFMDYKDQLVLTGKINDVGAYTRTNIPKSYRQGIELHGATRFNKWLEASASFTISRNKIENFTEYLDDYDNGGQQTQFYKEADIAFSPAVTSSYTLTVKPIVKMAVDLFGKYVSKQFLDNTSQDSRSLNAFFVQDIRCSYTWRKDALIFFQVNNIFSKKYEPNGYTFSYIYGGEKTTENFYFPMAPLNWVMGVNIRL